MSVGLLVLLLALGLAAVMAFAWSAVVRSGKSGFADAVWSIGTGAACAIAAIVPSVGAAPSLRQGVMAALLLLWGLRLGLHIAGRAAHGDDPRYAELKKQWGARYRSRLFLFLQIQAAASLVLAVSVIAAARNPAPDFGLADWIAVAIVAVAVAGEAIADRQLAAFRADPRNKGRVCDVGLWGLSRHPNYFFEWLVWMALPFFAFDASGGHPFGFVALAAPALMYWLLVRVSGIPPLEEHMLRSRGAAFRAYQRRVNAFWPGPPRPETQTVERNPSP
ncbi:DUF1295 domain-containing protein [Prosthecomicrobium pneumaticum]|uniref:Steroid 5-alpha reductase family enzyme n=1 Tax=Prosthecomicrobium pneumaticum TaxID=81895 RepID=A0A7W9CTB9_9HYPH|nr:DUF1295 domain-containing protein [Prosthecomicrobium pneumaticum]MBB5751520.1 steroid 5-alpha reductase family enzyme [Prosthecomicrobium pneumaticum]